MQLPPNHRLSLSAPTIGAGLALMIILSGVSSAQVPQPLAKRVPATDLFLYVEFDGFDAHAKEWKASAAYQASTGRPSGAAWKTSPPRGSTWR